jgi:hypothetical protein
VFVRTAAGVLVTAAFRCRDVNDPIKDKGTLAIAVTGLTGAAANGGTATVSSLDDPAAASLTVDIPASGTGSAEVDVGRYRVDYQPPTGFALATSAPNPQDVTVSHGATTTVSFAVVQATGTLRITVTGLGSASTGGSAQITRTDITGQSPVTVNVPAGGTVDTSVVPGTYQVNYTPPTGFVLAGGSSNPQTATVTANQTAAVTYSVTAAATGTLRITVTGLGSASSGGAAQIVRTDIPGQSPMTVNVPSSGTVDTSLAAGTYQINYEPPAGLYLAAGGSPLKTATVTANQATTVTYEVTATPTFAAPDILNNASFETGWDGFTHVGWDGKTTAPSAMERSQDHAKDGTWSVKHAYGPGAGGGTKFEYFHAAQSHVFMRFWFYHSGTWPTAPVKFARFIFDNNDHYGWNNSGDAYLKLNLGGYFNTAVLVANLNDAWHYLEIEYNRNQFGADLPGWRCWIDGNLPVKPVMDSPLTFDSSTGWINWNKTFPHDVVGFWFLDTINDPNSVNGTFYFDRIGASTQRIGP